MRKGILVGIVLGLAAGLAQAEVVELAPDLYLVVHKSRVENEVDIKISAINEANKFAASQGRVAVPVSGKRTVLGAFLAVYEYQFRVMNRADALAAKPVLADAVITVNSSTPVPTAAEAATAAALPDLNGVAALRNQDLLARLPPEVSASMSDSKTPDSTPLMCMPGTLCQPTQQCLPGYKCSPGMPPEIDTPTPPPVAPPT